MQQDANFNVTALVNTSGSVVERYTYKARTVRWRCQRRLDGAGHQRHHQQRLRLAFDFQGLRHETAADYHFTDTHIYSAPLGRFISTDWIGFAGGDQNLFRFVGNGPVNYTDPSGLSPVGHHWVPVGVLTDARNPTDIVGCRV